MIVVNRGEVWLANLNPTRGSEQTGIRPVVIFQADSLNKFTATGKMGDVGNGERWF